MRKKAQKPIQFMRQVVLRWNGKSVVTVMEAGAQGVAIPYHDGYGQDPETGRVVPMFGQYVLTHTPGDNTVSGLPVYR